MTARKRTAPWLFLALLVFCTPALACDSIRMKP